MYVEVFWVALGRGWGRGLEMRHSGSQRVSQNPESLNISSFRDIGNLPLKPHKDQTQKYTSYYFLERDIPGDIVLAFFPKETHFKHIERHILSFSQKIIPRGKFRNSIHSDFQTLDVLSPP